MSRLRRAQHALTRLDAVLPGWVRAAVDPETRTRARLFVVLIGGFVVLSGSAAILHATRGEAIRALFTAITIPPAVATLALPRWTRSMPPAIHTALAVILASSVIGPRLGGDNPSVAVGAATLPFLAVAVGGLGTGVLWLGLVLVVLSVNAAVVASDPTSSLIALNTLIVATACGVGSCILEFLRRGAHSEATRQAEQTEIEARQRKRVEGDLEESRALFRHAFKQAPALFVLSDRATFRILDVNESFERLAGWSLAEARGRTLGELGIWISPEDSWTLRDALGRMGGTRQVEIRLRTRTGEPVWLLAAANLVELGGVPHILTQAIDITDRKLAEQALASYRDQLEARIDRNSQPPRKPEEDSRLQQLDAIGTLAAGIAHQINNPIGAIQSAAEFALLARSDATPDADSVQAAALRTAIIEAKRCARIVRNVLRFSRQEPAARWTEDLNPLVRRAVELARTEVDEHAGQLSLRITREALHASISPIEIEQALVHLLHNAAESLRDGGTIRVRTRRLRDVAEIEIRDDGRGIEPERLEHVFEPFFTTRLQDGGIGLGLSFAHGVIRDHGGEMLIESLPEKGTRVRVRLPSSNAPEAT